MKFKVCDRVQFKTWEEMEKEFGLDEEGDINCRNRFTTDMKHLCGTFATVKSILSEHAVKLNNFTAAGETEFFFSDDMLKHANIEK